MQSLWNDVYVLQLPAERELAGKERVDVSQPSKLWLLDLHADALHSQPAAQGLYQ